MNKIIGFLFVMGMFATLANATSLHPDTFSKKAQLLNWDFDLESFVGSRTVEAGFIKVNVVTKTASLTLNLENDCPVGAMCIAYIPVRTLELPITKISSDDCGVVIYTAEKNNMMVDGAYEKLTIKDVSQSICEMYYIAPTFANLTETYYNRLEGRLVKANSKMTASKLQ